MCRGAVEGRRVERVHARGPVERHLRRGTGMRHSIVKLNCAVYGEFNWLVSLVAFGDNLYHIF